ncbi:hypothetical protein DPMN_069459 [Dreissena polymorpha]|uniref:Neurotransmitter-gated ion-channel ligand-binding domain-containing protein n=1 Tax=Dreissena polymorpha TaxID=45954 RepID=A0A9D3YZJ2_DREPO|nr:hypothetical protein DPMN_069411 [Dreissena polymorpha]KAH3709993.1 hypothetical protein DPMN_069459 [Dreissena polymorpha]
MCRLVLFGTLIIYGLITPGESVDPDIQTMKSLYGAVLDGYDTRIRPINNQSAAVYVNTKFVPQSLLEFDTSEQKFSMLGYFRITWIDEVIRWDPANYNGVDSLKIPITQMWRPSLIILKVRTLFCPKTLHFLENLKRTLFLYVVVFRFVFC